MLAATPIAAAEMDNAQRYRIATAGPLSPAWVRTKSGLKYSVPGGKFPRTPFYAAIGTQ